MQKIANPAELLAEYGAVIGFCIDSLNGKFCRSLAVANFLSSFDDLIIKLFERFFSNQQTIVVKTFLLLTNLNLSCGCLP